MAKANGKVYTCDGLHRLGDMQRGTLDATKIAMTNKEFAQDWSLDATGNWSAFREDVDGNGTWDLDQSRTANRANEISDIAETAGAARSVLFLPNGRLVTGRTTTESASGANPRSSGKQSLGIG